MKYTFVIDENVFIFAHTLEDETGQPDLSSSQLIAAIASNRHVFALDAPLWQKYCQKANSPVISIAPWVITVIAAAMADADRCRFETDVPPITKEEQIPCDDVPIVRLAALLRAILATTDGRLADALNASSIVTDTGIRALRPEAALLFAQEIDP